MNCSGFSKAKENEIETIVKEATLVKESYSVQRILNLIEQAYSSGAESMVNLKKVHTTAEASRKLQALSQDIFLENHQDYYVKYLTDLIESHKNRDGRLPIAFNEEITAEVYSLFKTIYDAGFINGVEVSKDPEVLTLYFKNKDKIINGEH